MIKVGFSTHRRNPLSALVRFLTGSKASHCWLLIQDEPFFGIPMVMEATEVGFRYIPLSVFKARNDIVAVVSSPYPLEKGVHAANAWLGKNYDFLGFFSTFFVLVGRWLKRKIKNPVRSSRAMFCSEAVARVLQASGYPGISGLDPSSVTPQDLLDLLGESVTPENPG
jgi:hypothetical protein